MLASGSKGNSTLVSSSRTTILVDAGLSCREFFRRMQEAGQDPRSLDAILITHEHQDHVQGLAVTARKLGIPVFFTAPTHRAWMRWMVPQKRLTYAAWLAQRAKDFEAKAALKAEPAAKLKQTSDGNQGYAALRDQHADTLVEELDAKSNIQNGGTGFAEKLSAEISEVSAESNVSSSYDAGPPECEEEDDRPGTKEPVDPCALPAVEFFEPGVRFSIGDIEVDPFTIPHDAADPVGFIFRSEGIKIGIATDLGYMPASVKEHLRGCDVLMLESNHDIEMLRDGPYPWSVKQRVMSRVGHLSNEATADFLEKNYDGGATYVILAHLSESNNLPELARVSAERALRDRMNLLCNRLVLAEQHTSGTPIQL